MKTFKTALLMASLVAGPALAQGYVPNERLTYTPTENGVRISGSTGFGARGTGVRQRVTLWTRWEPQIVRRFMSANRARVVLAAMVA